MQLVQPDRQIVHIDLDTFFVSVERLLDSRLNGRPVLVGGTSDRGVVASCSYEARTFGIHSGMSMKVARRLCPSAAIVKGDSGKYSHYSSMVTDIIKERVPLYEKTSVDEFYIDMTGMDRFFGSLKFADELRQTVIRETGLPISYGLSTNKTVSKVATGEAKPNGRIRIDRGTEPGFLAPLPVRKIPMVGKETNKLLNELGIKKIRTVQQMPLELLEKVMGKPGQTLWRKAHGIDPSPVIPYQERKSISMERTFDRDTIDVHRLRNLLITMAEGLSYQLRSGDKLTACITLKIRYSDFNTYSKQFRIPYTACDHTLIEKTLELFEKLYNRRLLVRLIGLRCSHLVGGGHQINMFEDTDERVRLYQAMDNVRSKYGNSRMVLRASGMGVPNMGVRGNPFNGEPMVPPAHRTA